MIFGVITEVPPPTSSDNMALAYDVYQVIEGRSRANGYTERVRAVIGLDLRRTVFHVGEVLIMNDDGREIPYPGRKPSKWSVTCEEFADLEAALARAGQVRDG